MSDGFVSNSGQSFESQQHVLALPQTETTSEHTFQSQQQGGGRTVEISPSGGHHQFFQRVIPSNSLQGAQWPRQQHFILMQQPQQVTVPLKNSTGHCTLSHPANGQIQLHPVQIQQHQQPGLIDSQAPKVLYLIQSGRTTSGPLPFQQVNLVRHNSEVSHQNLQLLHNLDPVPQRFPGPQVSVTGLPVSNYQQLIVGNSPLPARRPPKQPRLVQTQSLNALPASPPVQISRSPSIPNQQIIFDQQQSPRQILIQESVSNQKSQIIYPHQNEQAVTTPNSVFPQQTINMTKVSQQANFLPMAGQVRYIIKSVPQPQQPSFHADVIPNQDQIQEVDSKTEKDEHAKEYDIEIKKKWIVPLSEWTADYKNLVVDECQKHKILPSLLAEAHKVKLSEMRNLIKSKYDKLPSRYKVNKHADLAKLTLKSLEANPANYTEESNDYNFEEKDMDSTNLIQPSLSNQQPPQPQIVNNVLFGGQNLPTTIKVQTSHQVNSNFGSVLEPGKLVLCKNCGCLGSNLDRCPRCKKLITKDCKIIPDAAYQKSANISNKGYLKVTNKKSPIQQSQPISPELIQLSDDDDDDDDTSSSTERKSNMNSNSAKSTETEYFNPYELLTSDSENTDCETLIKNIEGIINSENGPTNAKFPTRSIRFGIIQSDLDSTTFFTSVGIMLAFRIGKEVFDKVVISNSVIQTVELSFQDGIPNYRLSLKPIGISKLRHQLKPPIPPMHEGKVLICGSKEDPNSLNIINELFHEKVKEIDWETMNNFDTLPVVNFSQEKGFIPNVEYCKFPQTDQGSVSVFSKDYACLGRHCYLNDVIIDFYLKWLQHNELSEIDRNRTHIFSSFFYNRLTMRDRQPKTTSSIKESRAIGEQRRYDRVKRWTKNVNIFEKDFVIVPINENSHWFVVVICFPGLVKSVNFETGEPCQIPERQSWSTRFTDRRIARTKMAKKQMAKSRVIQIGSTSVFSLKNIKSIYCEENPDCDEASDSDEDFVNIDEEDVVEFCKEKLNTNQANPVTQEKIMEEFKKTSILPMESKDKGSFICGVGNPEAQTFEDGKKKELPKSTRVKKPEKRIRQPCILIFDSLSGASRTRVAATLRGYLKCEYRAKLGQERDFNRKTMKGCAPKTVQQPNTYDCGIFVLKYIESFFKKPINDFCLPIKQCRNWFTLDEIKTKRAEIAKVIETLAAEQNPNNVFEYPDLNRHREESPDCSDGEEEKSSKENSAGENSGVETPSNLTNMDGLSEGVEMTQYMGEGDQSVNSSTCLLTHEQSVSSQTNSDDKRDLTIASENSKGSAKAEVDQVYLLHQNSVSKGPTYTDIQSVHPQESHTFTDDVSTSECFDLNYVPSKVDSFVMCHQETEKTDSSNGPAVDSSTAVTLPSFSSLIVGCHNDSSTTQGQSFELSDKQPLPSFSSINEAQSNSTLAPFDMANGSTENFESFSTIQSFSTLATSAQLPNFSYDLERGN